MTETSERRLVIQVSRATENTRLSIFTASMAGIFTVQEVLEGAQLSTSMARPSRDCDLALRVSKRSSQGKAQLLWYLQQILCVIL